LRKRRRHRGEATEGEEGDATPDLLLKHSNETFATYVRKQLKHLQHMCETLVKASENA
jgi:hypothetical protein